MKTKYGVLNGVEDAEYYSNGNLKLCRVAELNKLETSIGLLIPQYETRDDRRKITGTIEFYENGDLMSICLDEQIEITTKHGTIPAEKILFYKNEKIKRIFPLNGKLTGYWGEENEYGLAEVTELEVFGKTIKSKFISIAFYESGLIRSATFWPKEVAEIEINSQIVKVRKGISFYENGSIKSYEPAKMVKVKTPIGTISAFHNEIVGLNGDVNSIQFYSDGSLKSLFTCSEKIKIVSENSEHIIEPELKAGWCNELVKIPNPVKIDFSQEKIIFNENKTFEISNNKFFILDMNYKNIAEELTC